MEYVAIDFETANRYPDSACAIGLSLFDEEGVRRDSFYSLICPVIPYFDPVCTNVHHLDSRDVLRAPKLDEIWDDIYSFIGSRPLVAHNARFDMGVLKASLTRCGINPPPYEYYCTLNLARRLLPGYDCYKLTYLVDQVLGMNYHAHLASDDAYVCGKLFHRLCG
ncbi:MAG: 3'-5' exoribonuclease, partial [Sphaerochaetaceae bacterium]|nr:3'-5' exoribonuclease [Sphaerochaetaceae bacterium]